VVKHSAARRVEIQLERESSDGVSPSMIRLGIVDDGQGITLTLPTRGLGLIGMRERVAALDGALLVASTPRKGFELRASIPVRRSERSPS